MLDLQREGILLVQDGNHGEYRPRHDEFGTGDWAFIRAADMDAGRVLFESAQKINDAAFDRITKGIGKPGDVLFSHKGTVGKLALVPLDAPPFVCSPQTTFWRTLDESRLNRRFLYYFMQSRAFLTQWSSRKDETDMAAYVSLTAQRTFELVLPSLDDQKAIAAVLGSLDDKIEQNRRTGGKLEALARAVFKAWFVDFEPVKAKAAGATTFPGMTAETFATLPTRLVDSELGPVPEGWVPSPIGDSVEGIYDGPHATPSESKDGAVFLGIKNLTGTRIDLADIRRINERDWPRWTKRVEPRADDIVFTYEATIGFFAIIPHGLRCCLGRRMALIRPKAGVSSRYLFHYAVSDPFQQLLAERTVCGSTVNRTSLLEFPKYPILMPTPAMITAFESVAAPLWSSLHASDSESAKLAALRDYLLPKLLSGAVRVRDAQRAVAEAT